jgi:hypothetical protein
MSDRHPEQQRRGQTRRTSRNVHVRRGNPHKEPDAWVTGSRPMTEAQAAYLKTLCEHAGEAFFAKLTKAEAAKRIQLLRSRRW